MVYERNWWHTNLSKNEWWHNKRVTFQHECGFGQDVPTNWEELIMSHPKYYEYQKPRRHSMLELRELEKVGPYDTVSTRKPWKHDRGLVAKYLGRRCRNLRRLWKESHELNIRSYQIIRRKYTFRRRSVESTHEMAQYLWK